MKKQLMIEIEVKRSSVFYTDSQLSKPLLESSCVCRDSLHSPVDTKLRKMYATETLKVEIKTFKRF